MPLDRNTVERTAAAHIRRLARGGALSPEKKHRIRKMHERLARKVAAKRSK